MPTHALTIPDWTPALKNQWLGKHWRVRWKLGKEQTTLIATYARLQGIPPAAGLRRISLVAMGWPRGRLPDFDAFDALLLDSLRDAGLILDDSVAGIEGRLAVTLVRSRERRSIITLEDV